ncbi:MULTISPECIES: ParB/RepB/Spo0J family partition protein [Acutalibacteraceae]|uniref:ParB/RepB/Spo0J family partition protein n=1 Tax=Acutalibacteraceae TaxID=3082771 RepID=UPI001FAB2E44|nr:MULTISPECIES: ParB/RepB/Spo0J family partition protein [Acutalibacteraceae]
MLFRDKSKVVEISLDLIRPNPAQPRRTFREDELLGLSRSIRENGLLQPLLVRKMENGYELIAGERRLRACRMAGLKTASCLISSCTPDQSAVMAMTENIQRSNLELFEEAEGIRRLIERWNITQEEAAARLGKSQSSIANKLRLLRLTETERQQIVSAGLSERHARALLRLENPMQRGEALETVIEKGYNVRQTEEYIEKLLCGDKNSNQKKTPVIKDVRIFLNTISHAIATMKQSGISAQTLQSETEDYIECVVRIPKSQAYAGGRKPA